MTERKTLEAADIIIALLAVRNYLRRRWMVIFIYSLAGLLLGAAWSLLVKPKYTAVCTFVLDDNEHQGSLEQFAGLASLAGLDLTGNGGGIFKGDNIIELYKSRAMIKKTLFVATGNGRQKENLITLYAKDNNLIAKWNVNFLDTTAGLTRMQDSILTDVAERFDHDNLDVVKPDKKLSIIRVSFTSKDEFFAKTFTDNLVRNVNEFYTQTKIKKTHENVAVLQRQSDSVKAALNRSIYGAAAATEDAPLANPILTTLRSASQRKQVDVQAAGSIYGEMIKNLELAKIALRQQTPLIQYIDQPVYPLKNNHVKLVKAMAIGCLTGLVAGLAILCLNWLTVMLRLRVRQKLNQGGSNG